MLKQLLLGPFDLDCVCEQHKPIPREEILLFLSGIQIKGLLLTKHSVYLEIPLQQKILCVRMLARFLKNKNLTSRVQNHLLQLKKKLLKIANCLRSKGQNILVLTALLPLTLRSGFSNFLFLRRACNLWKSVLQDRQFNCVAFEMV